MTEAEIEKRVANIAAMVDDDEAAHSEEDALHRDVLMAIAEGCCEDPAACARAAMKTATLDFARWCA